jgi:chemotaxis protein histidine kinase CheA
MSQTNTTPPVRPEQSTEHAPPPAGQSPGQAPEPAPAPVVDPGLAEAKAKGEQERAALEQEAEHTLGKAVTCYRRGEREYRRGLLESGRWAGLHVRARLRLGHSRRAAVQTIEGQLALYSTGAVDANRLVACWESYRLLAEEQGLDKAAADVPYGHYRDHYSRLVERTHKDSPEECYALLLGLEAECRAAFKAAVESGTDAEAVGLRVRELLAEHAARQEAARKAEAQARAAEEAAKREQARQAAEARRAAEQAAREAKQAAEQAPEQEKAPLAEAARQAEEELRARQRAEVQAQAEAEAKARERARAEAAAREAERARQREEEKARRKAEREAARGEGKAMAPAGAECRGTNVLATLAKQGTSKDVAALMASAVWRADDPAALLYDLACALLCPPRDGDTGPDDVLDVLLRAAEGADLSGKARRAVKAARLVLERKAAPSPADVARALRGQPTTPAAAVA